MGLQWFMRDQGQAVVQTANQSTAQKTTQKTTSIAVMKALQAIMHPQLLIVAAIAMLVSVATFSFFSFISPYLLQVSALSVLGLSLAMLLFGGCTVIGNILGGWLADHINLRISLLFALIALALNLFGLYVFVHIPFMMMLLVGSLGIAFFAIVTMLTMLLLQRAQHYIPASSAVAAGLNIASFNLGTALGGGLGALSIAWAGLYFVPLVGAGVAVLAAVILNFKIRTTEIMQN